MKHRTIVPSVVHHCLMVGRPFNQFWFVEVVYFRTRTGPVGTLTLVDLFEALFVKLFQNSTCVTLRVGSALA